MRAVESVFRWRDGGLWIEWDRSAQLFVSNFHEEEPTIGARNGTLGQTRRILRLMTEALQYVEEFAKPKGKRGR